MPDTADNQACFPQSPAQKPGLGFPMARLVAIVSLSCGAVLEWAAAVHLAAYNLVRKVMAQAAYPAQVLSRELSFKAAMQLLRAFEQNLRHCLPTRPSFISTRHSARRMLDSCPGNVEQNHYNKSYLWRAINKLHGGGISNTFGYM
jgi:hypothetical protein